MDSPAITYHARSPMRTREHLEPSINVVRFRASGYRTEHKNTRANIFTDVSDATYYAINYYGNVIALTKQQKATTNTTNGPATVFSSPNNIHPHESLSDF